MPFLKDFFQNLFGGRTEHHDQGFDDHRRYGERFRNPIWQNGEEDDEYGDDDRGGNRGFHFQIWTDPLEMTRFFESQMDSMLKDFFHFGFDQGPSIDQSDVPSFPQLMPPPENRQRNLRDEVLKPGYGVPSSNYGKTVPKVDDDLDGKVSVDDFSRIWKTPSVEGPSQAIEPWGQPTIRSFGKSIISQTVRRPDGTIEERRTVTDSQGNSETTIKRQIGDKTHTIITQRDKDGVETKTENFQNIEEKDLENFKSWTPTKEPEVYSGSLTGFPWHKFFGNNPKL